MENFVTALNLKIRKNEKDIVLPQGEYEAGKACLLISSFSDITLDFSSSIVSAENCFIEIKNAQNVTIKNLSLKCNSKNDFAIKFKNAHSVRLENVKINAKNACLSISQSSAVVEKSELESDEGNGICIFSDSEVSVKTSNFAMRKGECVTVIDNDYGMVHLVENAFKKSGVGVKSAGRNRIKIANNYFMTALYSIGCFPSLFGEDGRGASKIDISYNIFDEFGEGETVRIEGGGKEMLHEEISIKDNIFSSKYRPAVFADGVKMLTFKDNSVKTTGESTVENSVINGMRA